MTCSQFECDSLRNQLIELQARNSRLVMERQLSNRYGDRRQRQRSVLAWAVRTFGEVTKSTKERALRLVEEAIEVGQAAGLSRAIVERLVERVYARDPGDLRKELGGVGVTLMAFAESIGESAEELDRDEIERIFGIDPAVFQTKHASKIEAGVAVLP